MPRIPRGRFGGCLTRQTMPGRGPFRPWGTDGSVPVLDYDAIAEHEATSLHNFHWWTPDQNGTNGCTTGMTVNEMTIIREKEGKPRVKLAMSSLFQWDGITINSDGSYMLHPRRSDNGMELETALLIAQLQGIAPKEINGEPYIDDLDWRGGHQGRWPGDWRQQAAKYRFSDEVWDVLNSQCVLSGVVLGDPVGRGQDRHAVCQIDKEDVLGSYGEDYGHKGHGEIGGIHPWGNLQTASGRRAVDAGILAYGAFCVRATLPEDAPPSEGLISEVMKDRVRIFGRRRFGRR